MKSVRTYTYTGTVAGTLADGTPLAPGKRVRMRSAEAGRDHNKRLIDAGQLVALTPPPAKRSGGKSKNKENA